MRVVFVQKFVPHYRLPFFEKVRDILNEHGISFVLLYADADPYEKSKVQMVHPEWGIKLKTTHIGVFGRYLYWKNVRTHLQRGDFVVVEHAAKLLDNYLIFAARQFGYLKMGYFGHGENFQSTTEYRISAVLKSLMLKKVDRWFAYTEVSQTSLLRQGVDENKITVVNNTLERSERSQQQLTNPSPYACIYVGGMYKLKLLPLLIEAATLVAERIPEFELHMVGDGPEREVVEKAAQTRPWLRVHGSLYGEDRDNLLANCNTILMPGLVGLIAIDSFHFQTPIITSDAGEHSPEIAYLTNNVNCLVDTGDVTAHSYSELILKYLTDEKLQKQLIAGCENSAEEYSLENMANNFCQPFIGNKAV